MAILSDVERILHLGETGCYLQDVYASLTDKYLSYHTYVKRTFTNKWKILCISVIVPQWSFHYTSDLEQIRGECPIKLMLWHEAESGSGKASLDVSPKDIIVTDEVKEGVMNGKFKARFSYTESDANDIKRHIVEALEGNNKFFSEAADEIEMNFWKNLIRQTNNDD